MNTTEANLSIEKDYRNNIHEWINEFHFWLSIDEINVAYMKADYKEVKKVGKLSLHDIEVREEYKGKGLSIEIMKQAAEAFNVDYVTHSGDYTPEGYERIFKHIHHERAQEIKGASYRAMTFVEDWEERILKNP